MTTPSPPAAPRWLRPSLTATRCHLMAHDERSGKLKSLCGKYFEPLIVEAMNQPGVAPDSLLPCGTCAGKDHENKTGEMTAAKRSAQSMWRGLQMDRGKRPVWGPGASNGRR